MQKALTQFSDFMSRLAAPYSTSTLTSATKGSSFVSILVGAVIIAFTIIAIITNSIMLSIIASKSVTRWLTVVAIVLEWLLIATLGKGII